MSSSDEPFNAIIPTHTVSRDLTDAEFAELADLLAATPEPYAPLDVVVLDGFLCGVLVQPVLIEPAVWLPYVFDSGGEPLSEYIDAAWRERCTALVLRRHAALNRTLVEDGWFDPLILEYEEDDVAASAEPVESAEAGDPGEPVEPVQDDAKPPEDPASASSAVSKPLMPWVAGFQLATQCFPDLIESDDQDIAIALARLYRHLPPETDDDREAVALLEQNLPLTTLDDAVAEMVATVADLADLTRDARYKVQTVRRQAPKVGRNDACPCGSGRKFKVCHGR